ncbi:MAG: translation initiation factor IF-2 [Deltaproteobacteria bacterium]|nr:translation initiation factor IF-2 [Candidatus Tharpellaceae bacterium]
MKLKVYELSRELNLKDAELLDVLANLGIPSNSRFSSLSYDQVEKVKVFCRENQGPGVLEKRLGSSIVRRRRKKVKPVVEETPAVETFPEMKTEETPSVEGTPKVAAVVEPEVEVPVAEKPEAEVVAEPEEEASVTVTVEGEDTEGTALQLEEEAMPVAAEEKPEVTEEKPAKAKHRGARVIGKVALKKLGRPVKGATQEDKRAGAKATGDSRQRPAAAGRPAPAQPEPPVEEKKAGRKGKKKGASPDGHKEEGLRKKGFHKKSVIKNIDLMGNEAPRGRRGKGKKSKVPRKGDHKTEITTPKEIKRIVKITEVISAGELAKRLGVKSSEIIRKLMELGVMATINQMIDIDTATIIAAEYGHSVENVAFDELTVLEETPDAEESLLSRPPVVTVMGHVDHGKTSLLDAIREARVVEGEAGGITQHIGAYSVALPKGTISFIDTPGHEAFTTMRSRGAGITDIVILVVAADDGVMPQTIESINHARAAEVPIIVAVNKIDKPDARPDEVKRQLSEHGVVAEDWGGDTIFVEVSAKERTNIDTLLEMILLQAEMMEVKANPNKPGKGVIIESRLDRGKGPLATVLVKEGTVKPGDFVVAGLYSGRVRALIGDHGKPVESAGPSMPVEVLGLSGIPAAGDDFNVVKSEKMAKELSDHRQHQFREREISKTSKISLEDLFDQIQEGEVEKLNIIVKADVHGSAEAVAEALEKISTEKVKVDVIHLAVGGIKEADVMLASASKAIIIGFNVRPDIKAQNLAEEEHVDIRMYSIIYDLIDDVKKAMVGLLQPEIREIYLGRAEVKEVFAVSKVGTIAGCRVEDGKVSRKAGVRLLRDNVVIYEGKISSLKRFKDDVKEVLSGYECGIGIEKYNDVKIGDVIEAFTTEEVVATL